LGLAKKLFLALEKKVKEENIQDFYLLTTTAFEYFKNLDFVCIKKEMAPESICRTEQFKSLCSASAVLMHLKL